MKQSIKAVMAFLAVILLFPAAAHAMSVDDPLGQIINGWYKDTITLNIHYGDGACGGNGVVNTIVYQAGIQQDGAHQYQFLSDDLDNPYLSIDQGAPQLLVSTPCQPSGNNLQNNRQFSLLSLDSLPPTVSITSPSSNITTSANDYNVSGTVTDTASGVQSVQLYVNGQPGPQATINGNTFTATVPLIDGSNSVQATALDNVNHTDKSNSIIISHTSVPPASSAGTSSPTIVTSSTPSPAVSSPSIQAPTNSPPTADNPQGQIKFANTHPIKFSDGYLDPPSKPDTVLQENGFSKTGRQVYIGLLIIILILLAAIVYLLWRNRGIFSRLDRSNSGLRKRALLYVSFPTLLPLIGLGILGYHQLSVNLKASLSQQLARAAQTSAIKLEREFAIRQKIISTNANNILQIKLQFTEQTAHLLTQKDACSALMRTSLAAGHVSTVTNSEDCLPFLTATAQVIDTNSKLDSYLQALNDGYTHALSNSQSDEQERTNTLLAETRSYFPDVNEMAITDNASPSHIMALLPSSSNKHPVTDTYKQLLQTQNSTLTMLYSSKLAPHQLLVTYPLFDSQKKFIGKAVVAYDTTYPLFIPAIWQATPKPYSQDSVYIVSDQGQVLEPLKSSLNVHDTQALAKTNASTLLSFGKGNEMTAVRVRTVSGTNLAVAVGAPPKNILAPLAGIQLTVLLAIVSFLLVSFLLTIFFVTGIAREIDTLLRGAWAFAEGKLDHRIILSSHDELSLLGNTMNQMAVDIKHAQDALIEKDKEFINIATHELKAPMTSIIGNLSMVSEEGVGQIDETARQLINQAYLGTTRLRDIVTDMLDIARLESGHAEFTLESLDIAILIQSAIDMQSTPAQQSQVKLAYVPVAAMPKVLADKNKLQIIITNFISNAIKYNRPGGMVTLSHEVKDGLLITSVSDTGLGIPADQQQHIFEKFYRVQHEDRSNVAGTGLGMNITKRFVEAMRGKVWFTSTHGKGTTFYFSLPLAPVANEATQPATTPLQEDPKKIAE
jgi:signal transduction histidine kinase